MSIKGIDKELWPTIFPHSLETIPQAWFYSMDPKKIETFDEISIEFDNQYRDNADTQTTMRTLEVLSQRDNEGFTEYLTRWRNVSTQIQNRANERELVDKFINNLALTYQREMRYRGIETFKQAINIGMKIEDDQRKGDLARYRARNHHRNYSKGESSK